MQCADEPCVCVWGGGVNAVCRRAYDWAAALLGLQDASSVEEFSFFFF